MMSFTMKHSAVLLLAICGISVNVCKGSIQDKVSYHEVISVHDTHLRDRRSVEVNSHREKLTKEFHFQAFNRTFNCHLTPRTDIFSPDFKLKVYGPNGVVTEPTLRKDQVFVGKCDGDKNSQIRGVFKHGIFSGSVLYEGQLYGVENAKHHIPIDESKVGHPKETMIVYRTSDIKWDKGDKNGHGPSFCGNTHAKGESKDNVVVEDIVTDKGGRYKRATTPSWNTCRMIAVADFKFFSEIGDNDIYDTAIYMAGVMDRVDNIYRATQFSTGSAISGLGFEIAEMRIHTVPTVGYNKDVGSWNALALLQAFSKENFGDFCVAHLFTYQSFEGNVLGLAYIAPPREGGIGGICSRVEIEGTVQSLNTGWTSSRNQNSETILMQQSDLVTAHELGHNWGSEHDPESGECSPSSGGGKYLMYPYSVGGYDSNNYKFSSCSRSLVSRVLNLKGRSCFVEKFFDENQVCGNGIIDSSEGEECDAGYIGRFNIDKCCDNTCRLAGTAVCSPVNHECCFNCQVATIGTVCRAENNIDCLKSAVCSGSSLECPPAAFKDDDEPCLDEGMCKSGVCKPFCEARNLTSCACPNVGESCQRCCRVNAESECKPFDNQHPLPDGRPCVIGYCSGGTCKASTVSTVQRLFDYLESLDINSIVQFFRDNLVGSVIVFSLILWIPCCIIIWCTDRRSRKRMTRSENIEIRTDRTLMFDEDGRKVIPTKPSPRNGTTSPRYRNFNFTDLGGFGSDA